jgi:hypothetical protein
MARPLSQEFLFELSEDSDLAFTQVEGTARAELESILGYVEERQEVPSLECELDYMGAVLAAAEEFGIDELLGWELPGYTEEHARTRCRNFRQEAKRVALKLSIRSARRAKGHLITFDAATKLQLRHHLEQIRQIVDKLEISTGKKEKLNACIDDLEAEIGKDRTRAETYGALAMEVATYAEDASGPLARAFMALGKVFGLAKDSAKELQRFPAPGKPPKQIEAPKPKRIEAPKARPATKSFVKDLDDEIPF